MRANEFPQLETIVLTRTKVDHLALRVELGFSTREEPIFYCLRRARWAWPNASMHTPNFTTGEIRGQVR